MAGRRSTENNAVNLVLNDNLMLSDKVKQIIDEEFADFEKYMPTPQDRRMYQRKRSEYWGNIAARLQELNALKETNSNNGRTDSTADDTAVGI